MLVDLHHALPAAYTLGRPAIVAESLTSPCGVGQVGARLRIYAGAMLAGTGDAGPHWKLPDCGGGA